MHMEARMGLEPAVNRGTLVGAVVVTDEVHVEVLRDLAVDLDQELLELDRAVTAVRRADHRPVCNVERGKQARGPVP